MWGMPFQSSGRFGGNRHRAAADVTVTDAEHRPIKILDNCDGDYDKPEAMLKWGDEQHGSFTNNVIIEAEGESVHTLAQIFRPGEE
ncbi:hypothetical protein chiPu_0017654 [Chiloscyllium punctatum]|uniref:Uncharacterized protein n=1 Tax=Chiloscyllium punctatum TaxID=137246 RepID=A0A401RHW8_CHIPU|nr:hypothetical protein [Chiloscyllium punctatum]